MRILIDCDDVLINFVERGIDILNKKYNTDYTTDDVHDGDMTDLWDGIPKSELCEVLNEEFFGKEITPKKDAQKYVKQLIDEGHEIYIVTATHYKNIAYKMKYVFNEYFPYLTGDNIIVCKNKQLIDADILVDDYIENLKNGSYNKILFKACHNKDSGELFPESDIHFVNDGKECYDLISNYTG